MKYPHGKNKFELESVNCSIPLQKPGSKLNLIEFGDCFKLKSNAYNVFTTLIYGKEILLVEGEYAAHKHNRRIVIANTGDKFIFLDEKRFDKIKDIVLVVGGQNLNKCWFTITKDYIEYFVTENAETDISKNSADNKIRSMLNDFYSVEEFRETEEYKNLSLVEGIIT